MFFNNPAFLRNNPRLFADNLGLLSMIASTQLVNEFFLSFLNPKLEAYIVDNEIVMKSK